MSTPTAPRLFPSERPPSRILMTIGRIFWIQVVVLAYLPEFGGSVKYLVMSALITGACWLLGTAARILFHNIQFRLGELLWVMLSGGAMSAVLTRIFSKEGQTDVHDTVVRMVCGYGIATLSALWSWHGARRLDENTTWGRLILMLHGTLFPIGAMAILSFPLVIGFIHYTFNHTTASGALYALGVVVAWLILSSAVIPFLRTEERILHYEVEKRSALGRKVLV